eukprot:3932626-Rhodomonas_salina.3
MQTFFDALQDFYVQLAQWQLNPNVTKEDVIRNCRSRLASIIAALLSAPQVGTAFAHPSDTLEVDWSRSSLDNSSIVFKSDASPV